MSWLKTSVDMEVNTIMVSPGKTQGYENPIHLRIKMGQALREVVSECVRSPIAPPLLDPLQAKGTPPRTDRQQRPLDVCYTELSNEGIQQGPRPG